MENILSETGKPVSTSALQSVSPSDAYRLLEACLDPEGWVCITGMMAGANTRQKFFGPGPGQLDAAVDCAMKFDAAGTNAYFGTSTFLNGSSRQASNVRYSRCQKIDIDVCADDPRKYASKRKAIEALMAFCDATGLPAPTTVDSGNGVHAYWPLTEALNAADGKLYSEKFKAVCIAHDLKIDVTVTGDTARILRVPGTRNFKDPANPKPVKLKSEIIEHDTDEILALIDALHAARCAPLHSTKSSIDIFDVPVHLQNLKSDDLTNALAGHKPKSFALILEKSIAGTGCEQLKFAHENQASIDEPRWRAALSIAQFCEDRDEAIHQISKKHADYSPEETEQKASSIPAPWKCETFAANWQEQCAGCVNKFTSPIVLGIDHDGAVSTALAGAIEIVRAAETLSKAGDDGAALEEHVIDALRTVKQNRLADFQRLRTALKESNPKLSMKALDAALADEAKDEPRNAASVLIKMAKEKCELFHNSDREPHATFERDGHRECWALNSNGFSEWLSYTAYREGGTAPAENTLTTALGSLSGAAKFDGQELPIAVRVAKHGDDYFVDLCDAHWQAVRINASGWQVVAAPPVYFVRTSAMRALPTPAAGGDIGALWGFVNVDTADQLIVLAWMIECFRVDTPFPILELFGEQGSAKSFTQNILRELIDPNKANLRAKPKTIDDLFVTAKASHMVSLENLSHLAPDFQDALCAIATGAGHGGRQLYSDSDEHAFTVKRPSMLNGISVCATRSDLMDRTLLINLPSIATRRTESDLQEAFEKQKSQLFGALLDLFVGALKVLPTVKISSNELPRMADFAHLGEALYRFMGRQQGDFLADYLNKRRQGILQTVDSNAVAAALITWLQQNPGGFSGTAKELHDLLIICRTGGEQWPHSIRGFSDSLRRAAPGLRTLGHTVICLGRQHNGYCWQVA